MPDSVDVLVGLRVRRRRMLLGISQEALGKALGISYQQVQRYERGASRIGARRLFEFALVLGVSVDHFFEGAERTNRTRRKSNSGRKQAHAIEAAIMAKRETIELLRAYCRIGSASQQKSITDFVIAIAEK